MSRRRQYVAPNHLPLSAERRILVYTRDGRKCRECGTTERLTVDHLTPRSQGGTNSLHNLQTLCFACNQRKANKDVFRRAQTRKVLRRETLAFLNTLAASEAADYLYEILYGR